MKYLIAICFILTLVFACLFILDLNGYFNEKDDVVAMLSQAQGSVRRLTRRELSWDKVFKGSGLAFQDTVATGEGSKAEVSLIAGGLLDLDPNSMVVLAGSPSDLKLDFIAGQGKVLIDRRAQQNVRVFKNNQQIFPGQAGRKQDIDVQVVEKAQPVAANDDDMSKFSVLSLQPRQSQSLAKLDDFLDLQYAPRPPVLISPENQSVIDLAKEKPVLKWHTSDKDRFEIRLQAQQGEKLLSSQESELIPNHLFAGQYEWSVRSINSRGLHSAASQTFAFTAINSPLPARKPANAQKKAPKPEPELEKFDESDIRPVQSK